MLFSNPENGAFAGFQPPPPRLNRADSVTDNDAVLEDENLLTPEESPTRDCGQWETIETMIINGNEATFVPT